MIAGSEKGQATAFGPENKAKIETGPTFEIILAKPANAQTRMKMRFSKSIADVINRSRYIATAQFRHFPNVSAKRF
ncbi:MAG TPA: hypothetical protein VGQ70_06325 [Candidatus Udaeobacter sp.]|jgi:hypothetical protein|nr:hypothetical protein [Candidatus Udaeobacter sp.]